jgi:uncharacterized membrane protein YbaN (DUF454 family)
MILIIKQSIGFLFLIMGIAGVFLPVIPGFIFIVIGTGILGSDHKLVIKIRNIIRNMSSKE